MALKGTLKDFSVADIFQLIGQQGKSGSLYVRTKDREAHIVFDGGKVVLGTFKKSDEDFLLGTMLLRANVITADQLTKAIENQKSTLRSLGDILKSTGAVGTPVLSEFVALQLREVLFRIFQWQEGLYEFVPEKIQYNKAIIKPQSAEGVLMDGFRMLDEWPAISKNVGSAEGVFRALTNVDHEEDTDEAQASSDSMQDQLDRAFSDSDESVPDGEVQKKPTEELSPEFRRILGFLDGRRSLQEVVYLGRLGTFETFKAVSMLLERGLVEKVNELSPTRVVSPYPAIRDLSLGQWFTSSFKSILIVFGVSVLIPVMAFGVRSHWSLHYTDPRSNVRHETRLQFSDVWELTERRRIERSLEAYQLEMGRYPNSLEDLQDASISPEWKYHRAAETFELLLLPDRP